MIIERLKTLRKPSFPSPVMGTVYQNGYTMLPQPEYLRRNNIIVDMAAKCQYKVGDMVRPYQDEVYEKEGLFKVLFIASDWITYKAGAKDETKVDWPISDMPLIVTARNEKNGTNVIATPNYFTKVGA